MRLRLWTRLELVQALFAAAICALGLGALGWAGRTLTPAVCGLAIGPVALLGPLTRPQPSPWRRGALLLVLQLLTLVLVVALLAEGIYLDGRLAGLGSAQAAAQIELQFRRLFDDQVRSWVPLAYLAAGIPLGEALGRAQDRPEGSWRTLRPLLAPGWLLAFGLGLGAHLVATGAGAAREAGLTLGFLLLISSLVAAFALPVAGVFWGVFLLGDRLALRALGLGPRRPAPGDAPDDPYDADD